MNESGFTTAVNGKLPSEIYVWKVSDRFSAGVPDVWYSFKKSMFIEYKYYAKGLPKNVTPNLSALQKLWLNRRYDEGRAVFVVVGSPTTCLVYSDKEWMAAKPRTCGISRAELVEWIRVQVS